MRDQKFIASFRSGGAEEQEVAVRRLADGQYEVTLDGRTRRVDARKFEAGTWSLIIDDQSYDVELEVEPGTNEGDGMYNTLVRGQVTQLTVQDERRRRMMATAGPLAGDAPNAVLAPMPGKIVKILVKPGQEVAEGDPIIVVEAMKMENELRASCPATVSQVLVAEGDAVEARAKLIAFE